MVARPRRAARWRRTGAPARNAGPNPSFCVAAAAGCGWTGDEAEQARHEAACPFAICMGVCMRVCMRVAEPLQLECQELRAHVAALELQRAQADPALTPTPPPSRTEPALFSSEPAPRRHRVRRSSQVHGGVHGASWSERAAEAGVIEAVAVAMGAHPYGFTWRESAGEIGCIGVQGTCDMCICKSNSKRCYISASRRRPHGRDCVKPYKAARLTCCADLQAEA